MSFKSFLVSLKLPQLLAQVNTDLMPFETAGLEAIPSNPAFLVGTEEKIINSIVSSLITHVGNVLKDDTPAIAVTVAAIPTVVTAKAAGK